MAVYLKLIISFLLKAWAILDKKRTVGLLKPSSSREMAGCLV